MQAVRSDGAWAPEQTRSRGPHSSVVVVPIVRVGKKKLLNGLRNELDDLVEFLKRRLFL